jgi:hypothetical protein
VEFKFVYACGRTEEQKYILSLSLGLVKIVTYDFPHPCGGPQNSHLFLKWPVVDIEFDMPVLDQWKFISQEKAVSWKI